MDLRATEWAVWAAPDARLMRHSKYPDPSPVIPWNRAMISLNITGNIGARYESPPFFPSKIIRNFSNLWYLFVLFFFLFFDIYKDFNGNWIDSIS